MGVLVKEEGGKIWLRINHHGSRKSKLVGPASKATMRAAEKAAEEIRAKLTLGGIEAIAPEERKQSGPPSPLLKHVCAEWMEWHQKSYPRRETTQENYRSFIDSRLIPALGDRRASAITRAVCQEFIAALRTEPDPKSRKVVAYSTLLGHYLPTFRKILDFCVEREYLAVNPFRSGSKLCEPSDADREAAPEPKPFKPSELSEVLAAAHQIDPAFELFLRTWSQCGARSGEVRALQVRDLDLSKGTITISKTLHDRAGKVWTGPTKRPKRSNRVASLRYGIASDRPADALLARLAAHCRGKAATDFIFEKPSGGPITFGSLHERWRRALDLAGIEHRESEQLRHTFCSVTLSRGENPLKIAKQTGHSVKVLLGSYAEHVEEEPIRKQSASRLRAVR
jgi:integrase